MSSHSIDGAATAAVSLKRASLTTAPATGRLYRAKRAGFLARIADKIGQDRAEALIAALEREAATLGLERGSPEFWREAERRVSQI